MTDLAALRQSNREQIQAAGARYSPGIDPNAPNLQISHLVDAIEAISFSPKMKERISKLIPSIEEKASYRKEYLANLFQRSEVSIDDLLTKVKKILSADPEVISGVADNVTSTLRKVTEVLRDRQSDIYDQQRKVVRESEEYKKFEGELHGINEVLGALQDLQEYVFSPAFRNIFANTLLLKGAWGTGKTHLLCDVIQNQASNDIPSFFVLGHRLPRQGGILDQFLNGKGIASSLTDLCDVLSAEGRSRGRRILIIVDALNEGERSILGPEIDDLLKRIKEFPYLALVVSCRTPFEEILFSENTRKTVPTHVHRGFDEIEFEAQKEFFKFYEIPLPEVPLLSDEFSRPLFLKVICESLKDMTSAKKKKHFGDIASGQIGFTYVLELFFWNIGSSIEARHGLRAGFCWNLCKSNSGIASKMAESLRAYLYKDECLAILQSATSKVTPALLLSDLIAEGLLVDDLEWFPEGRREIIRLPYEKFSDHIIARHLLAPPNLDSSSTNAIRSSFSKERPLGKIFLVDKHQMNYAMPSLAEAIMLEFPQRVHRKVPATRRELVFYLPKESRYIAALADVFLDGLYWRPINSFCKDTHHIIRTLLKSKNEQLVHKTLDVLFSLSTKSEHLVSADRLWKFLLPMKMSDRDVFWTEFVREYGKFTSLRRVLDWIEQSPERNLPPKSCRNFILILSLCLTTTDRKIRDEVTRAIFLLGKKNMAVVFDVALKSLEFNDAYIPERLLAASYGVAMANINKCGPADKRLFGKFVRSLISKTFIGNSNLALSKHALVREYIMGLMDLAKFLRAIRLSSSEESLLMKKIREKRAPFPRFVGEKNKKSLEGKKAFRMDFENYSIGSLIEGRSNYDAKHPLYIKVKQKIAWRVADLGFSEKKFKTIDARIGDRNWNRDNDPEKVDRYGKKYSWIAFFEMMGFLEDQGKLRLNGPGDRTSKVDIDPSFPQEEKSFDLNLPDVFSTPFTAPSDWTGRGLRPDYSSILRIDSIEGHSGPWVVIDGYVEQKSQRDARTIFTFMDALFLDAKKKSELVRRFNEVEYPGNEKIPKPHEEYYTFAGEIPWSKQFAAELRESDGRPKPRYEYVFPKRITRKYKTRVKLAWIEVFKKIRPQDVPKLKLFSYEEVTDPVEEKFYAIVEQANKEVDEGERIGIGDLWRIPKEVPDSSGFTRIEKAVDVAGIRVEVPSHAYSWESYHCKFNKAGGTLFPTPALCDKLKLYRSGDTLDFNDSAGKLAATYRTSKEKNSTTHMLYLREDLLEKYLDLTSQSLVWLLWGERRFTYDYEQGNSEDLKGSWNAYQFIHRGAVFWKKGSLSYL